MTYSEKIRQIRESLKLNMRDFGTLVNLNFSTISLLEKGFRGKNRVPIIPLIDTLKQICDRTGYPFRKFLEETGYIEPFREPSPTEAMELKAMLGELITENELKNLTEERLATAISAFKDALNEQNE